MARTDNTALACVVFRVPARPDASWSITESWSLASAIPGVAVVSDEGGAETALFGARTSGCVLVFDKDGSLIFEGGITGSRGSTGENPGSCAAAALILGAPAEVTQTPVFGCDLAAPACPLCAAEEAP